MEIQVKLCGFCNPMFDPGEFIAKLKKKCPGHNFLYCSEPEKADLILNGCQTGCVQNLKQGRAMVVAGFSINGKNLEGIHRTVEEICSFFLC